jgi:hypothetical protein
MTDGQRISDPNNPRGYYEFELVKSLARNPEVMTEAEGKAVKVVSSLLRFLPSGHEYRIIFMLRPLVQVVASQDRMLERLGKAVPAAAKESVIAAFEQHLKQVRAWLSEQKNMSVLYVDYISVLEDAINTASRICTFLQKDLDTASMATMVDLSLHREKLPG